MPSISQTPQYNLKAVLRETGLTADVLRAWERRYGLPQPERTPGGQRLYSKYDIELILWLKARQAEGLSISRAAEQWKETREAGRDPLVEPREAQAAPQPSAAHETPLEQLCYHWLEACLRFDEAAADQTLNQAFGLYPVEMVCTEFLQHGLNMIGSRWYQGEISVQQEHFTSAQAVRRLETLITATPPPTRAQTVLVGCPSGEYHTFPALMLTLFLRRRGFNLVYLGADIPVERLTETIAVIRPQLVVLAAQTLPTALSLSQAAAQLQARSIQVAYGGWVFNQVPALRQRIPAHFLGETIETSLENVEWLSAHPQPAPQVATAPETLAAARVFRQQRALVEAEVLDSLQAQGFLTEQIPAANIFLGEDLLAALQLGEPSALALNLEWIRARIVSLHIPPAQFSAYLSAYQQSIVKLLGAEGQIIQDWIAN